MVLTSDKAEVGVAVDYSCLHRTLLFLQSSPVHVHYLAYYLRSRNTTATMPRRYNTRDAKDAVTGDIFWLSPRPTIREGSQTNKGIRDIFDHPVLVLSIHTDERIACVLIVCSMFFTPVCLAYTDEDSSRR